MMYCRVCNRKTKAIFAAKILNKYNIHYYECSYCGFVQTEEPYWLHEAYRNSINISDTGYINRNLNLSKKLNILLSLYFNKNKKFVDYAGGYGFLVRLMRDIGFDFYWDDKYTQNIFANGFEYIKEDYIEAVTAFECLEHFVNPVIEIKKIARISNNIIFSTEVLPNPTPSPSEWWYYGLNHGQHVSFYSRTTLIYIAKTLNLNYFNLNNFHLFTNKKNISNIKLKFLKLHKIGLHTIFMKLKKSRMWDDFLKLSKK